MQKKKCSIVQCDRDQMAKGYCNAHYQQVRRGEYPRPIRRRQASGAMCQKCDEKAKAYDLCREHFNEYMRTIPRTRNVRKVPEGRTVAPQPAQCPVANCGGTMGSRESVCYNHRRWGWRYGIQADSVASLLNTAKCRNPACQSTENLHMDHDHACCNGGERNCGNCNRGFLCRTCNTALGFLRDDPKMIQGLLDCYYDRLEIPTH